MTITTHRRRAILKPLGLAAALALAVLAGGTPPATADPGSTERLSVDSDGNEGNSFSSSAAISSDGRYVAFLSGASNLVVGDTNGSVDTFVHDRQTGVTERVSVASDGTQAHSHGHADAHRHAAGRCHADTNAYPHANANATAPAR